METIVEYATDPKVLVTLGAAAVGAWYKIPSSRRLGPSSLL